MYEIKADNPWFYPVWVYQNIFISLSYQRKLPYLFILPPPFLFSCTGPIAGTVSWSQENDSAVTENAPTPNFGAVFPVAANDSDLDLPSWPSFKKKRDTYIPEEEPQVSTNNYTTTTPTSTTSSTPQGAGLDINTMLRASGWQLTDRSQSNSTTTLLDCQFAGKTCNSKVISSILSTLSIKSCIRA